MSERDCECVPGHRCDCIDLRQLLTDILTNAEYPKMEAEGLAADALGLHWSEKDDRYVRAAEKEQKPKPVPPGGLSRLTLDELRDRAEANGITWWDDQWTRRDFIEALAEKEQT